MANPNPPAETNTAALEALGPSALPAAPKNTFGRADQQMVQAEVSELKEVKEALLDPPSKPSNEGTFGALAAAGLVAYSLLYDRAAQKWHVPTTGYENFVLIAVIVHAYVELSKWVKSWKRNTLTLVCVRKINRMIRQVERVEDPTSLWESFKSRRAKTPPA